MSFYEETIKNYDEADKELKIYVENEIKTLITFRAKGKFRDAYVSLAKDGSSRNIPNDIVKTVLKELQGQGFKTDYTLSCNTYQITINW